MDVAHDDLVSALVVGLRLPHAEGDRVGLRVREELEAAALDDLGDALVELEGRRGRALHRDGEIRRRVCGIESNSLSQRSVALLARKKRKYSRTLLCAPSTAEYDSWTSTIWGGPPGPTSRRGVLG